MKDFKLEEYYVNIKSLINFIFLSPDLAHNNQTHQIL